MERKDRLIWLDNLRCIAMFVVVMGHVYMGATPDTLRYYIYSFHMPLFFAISGAGYYLQTSRREYSFAEMLTRYLRVLLPYFVFSMLNIPILIIMDYLRVGHSNKDVSELIIATLYANLDYKSMPTGAVMVLPCAVPDDDTVLLHKEDMQKRPGHGGCHGGDRIFGISGDAAFFIHHLSVVFQYYIYRSDLLYAGISVHKIYIPRAESYGKHKETGGMDGCFYRDGVSVRQI